MTIETEWRNYDVVVVGACGCLALWGAWLLVLTPLQLSGAVHGLAGCHGNLWGGTASCNSGQS